MTYEPPKVLLAANDRQVGLLGDLAELMERYGISYLVRVGRDNTLREINRGNFKVLYLPNQLDLGSDRYPPQECYELIEKSKILTSNGLGKRYAAMFECLIEAKKKGLDVVVEEGIKDLNDQIISLGAIPTSNLDQYNEFQIIKGLLEKHS